MFLLLALAAVNETPVPPVAAVIIQAPAQAVVMAPPARQVTPAPEGGQMTTGEVPCDQPTAAGGVYCGGDKGEAVQVDTGDGTATTAAGWQAKDPAYLDVLTVQFCAVRPYVCGA